MEFRQLPGPPGIPLLGNLLQMSPSKFHRVVEKWSDAYGPIFKIKLGPTTVAIITDPEGIQYVLKNRPDKFRRLARLDDIIREMGFSGVFNAEGEDWKRQRRLVSQALNMNHLKTFFPTLVSITNKLLNRWKRLASEHANLDIRQELMRYTVDITSRMAFGYNMNTIEKSHDIIQEQLEDIFPAIFKRVNMPIPYWRYFKTRYDRKVEKSLYAIVATMQGVIDETKHQLELEPSLKNNPTNFLQALIAESDEEGPISNEVVIGNVLTMLLAGEDTTAHTIAWILYYMHLNPVIQQKARDEVDAVLGDKNIIDTYEQTTKLPYLEAIAYEAMRLKPVAPLIFFETIEDVTINNVNIPKNTGVFVQTQYSANSDSHFSNPNEFIPERWMTGGCPYLEAHNERAFVPFGAGPRFCPGFNLAMTEMKAVLAMIFKNFELDMQTDPSEVTELLAFTMMPTRFLIKLTTRG